MLSSNSKSVALLIDPEKYREQDYLNEQGKINQFFDLILVGGSSDSLNQIDQCIQNIKANFNLPVYIFPGSHDQISSHADGILYLSLISGDNPKYLIGEHRKSARKVKSLGLSVVPTGYILIDGGNVSSVQKVSNTTPVSQQNIEEILDIAVAGELLGMQMIYLEAGSGAQQIIAPQIIQSVKHNINIPLIVGGGIRSREEIENAFNLGANMVVIGTFIEEDSKNINLLKL